MQLIDATSFYTKLRKALGNKRNEIGPEERKTITELYANFEANEYCKIFDNEDFMYREYTVMQPLQRSYAFNAERIEKLGQKFSGSDLVNSKTGIVFPAAEVENAYQEYLKANEKADDILSKVIWAYEAIKAKLAEADVGKVYYSLTEFMPVLENVLADYTTNKKALDKIADGLSVMDKQAEIQKDKKGNVLYDKETKDTELVPYKQDIADYMQREVLPHVPDAKAFFEEDLSKKKPVIKTGAEIPFTRYFYKYQKPEASADLEAKFLELEQTVNDGIAKLFGGDEH